MKRRLIALGVAVAAPLLSVVAMTAATAAVAHAIVTGSLINHRQGHR